MPTRSDRRHVDPAFLAALEQSGLARALVLRAPAVRGFVLLAMVVQALVTTGTDWSYVVNGAHSLLGTPGVSGVGDEPVLGLRVYAEHPDYQMGPLTFVLGAALSLLGPLAWPTAVLLQAVMILHVMRLLRRRDEDAEEPTVARALLALVVDALMLIALANTALAWGHLDDMLVLWLCVVAAQARVVGRWWALGLCLGLALAAKPTALLLLGLGVRADRGVAPAGVGHMDVLRRLGPALGALGLGVATWLPFFVVEPRTLTAGQPQIVVLFGSVPELLGVPRYADLSWVRPAQVVLGGLLVVLCIQRGRWELVPLAAFGSRVLLDPGAFDYYAAYVIVGIAVAAAYGSLSRADAKLALAFLVFLVLPVAPVPSFVVGFARLVACVLLLAEIWSKAPVPIRVTPAGRASVAQLSDPTAQ